jgi:hypothetical protein
MERIAGQRCAMWDFSKKTYNDIAYLILKNAQLSPVVKSCCISRVLR